jgi:hypothetical protein
MLVTEIRRLRTTDLALFNRKLADWLVFYNTKRPHHSLSQQSPLSFIWNINPSAKGTGFIHNTALKRDWLLAGFARFQPAP